MKISFSITFYIFSILILISGYINYFLIYLGIMFIHELGHIIAIKICKNKIIKIKFYPFGGIMETNINFNISSIKLFFISISGVLAQSLLFIIVFDNSTYNYDIFYNLNLSLIIYNLLPIYPLDGYKIVLSISENYFKYRISIIISNIISILFIFFFYIQTKNAYIFILIYIMNVTNIIEYPYIINKFILERYLYKTKRNKNKYINKVKNIYKSRNNYILCDNIYKEEEEVLEKYLCKSIDI